MANLPKAARDKVDDPGADTSFEEKLETLSVQVKALLTRQKTHYEKELTLLKGLDRGGLDDAGYMVREQDEALVLSETQDLLGDE